MLADHDQVCSCFSLQFIAVGFQGAGWMKYVVLVQLLIKHGPGQLPVPLAASLDAMQSKWNATWSCCSGVAAAALLLLCCC